MKYNVARLAFRAKSLITYALKARSHHYLHAPFAYHLCTDVLYERKVYNEYKTLQLLTAAQRKDKTSLSFIAAGASSDGKKITTDVSKVAQRYSLPRKHARLLFRLVRYLKPSVILETGTGTGFSSAALALGNANATVHTIDAVNELTHVAKRYHTQHGIHNVKYHSGDLDHILTHTAKNIAPIDFIYLDANHTYEATLRYYNVLLPFISEHACIVVDDVHWSHGMKKAWVKLTQQSSVTLSMDLFRLGLLFNDRDLNREALRVYF